MEVPPDIFCPGLLAMPGITCTCKNPFPTAAPSPFPAPCQQPPQPDTLFSTASHYVSMER